MKSGVNVWNNTSRSDDSFAHALVELFIVLDGQLNVAWGDAVLLVVLGGISGELEKLSCQVFKNGCHVDWRSCTDTLSEATSLQVSTNATDREGQASLGGTSLWSSGLLGGGFLGSFAGHGNSRQGNWVSN